MSSDITAIRSAAGDWDNPRHAIDYTADVAARYGWAVAESALAAADLDRIAPGAPGVGDAIALTLTRGTGEHAERMVARFRVVPLHDAVRPDCYRFIGGDADGTAVRPWVRFRLRVAEPPRA